MKSLLAVNAEIQLYGKSSDSSYMIPVSDELSRLINSITLEKDMGEFFDNYPIIARQSKLRLASTVNHRNNLHSENGRRYEIKVPITSSFAETYFLTVMIIARKLRRLYKSCHDALREEPSARRKCELLHLGLAIKKDFPKIIESRYLQIDDEFAQLKERCYRYDLDDFGALLSLPYTDFYEQLYKQYGAALKAKYGSAQDTRAYHKDRLNPAGIMPDNLASTEYHFWDNALAEKAIDDAFFEFAFSPKHRNDEEHKDEYKALKLLTSTELAKSYLRILDEFLMSETRMVRFQIDSVDNTLKLISRDLEEAVYLWLVVENMSQKEVSVCKMCGSVFEPTRPNNLYCERHTQWQINYFNRKVNRMNEKLQEEQKGQLT